MSVQQTIAVRYTDSENLYEHLKKYFPDGDFSVHTEMGSYILHLSRLLTESELANIKRHYTKHSERRSKRG